jgi:hypothetical protein
MSNLMGPRFRSQSCSEATLINNFYDAKMTVLSKEIKHQAAKACLLKRAKPASI